MSSVTDRVRRFNRFYTQRIGVLGERFLDRDRPLGPARLLWEIGPDGRHVSELRDALGLDSGYVSRLLRSLEGDGLVTTSPDPTDGRRRVAILTAAGEREWRELDERSNEQVASLLEALDATRQQQLVEALATAERLLRLATVTFEVVGPRSQLAIASLTAYFRELDDRFDGGFAPGDTLVADADSFEPPGGAFLIASSGEAAVACGAVLTLEDGVGEIKRMWVDPSWRGVGLGARMLAELEGQAAALGHHTVRLDTNSALTEAISLYESSGYRSIERYNDNPFARRWFEKTLA